MGWQYWFPPLLGALIGLATNQVAIWMLFHPREKWHLFGIPLPFTPGVIPRDRRELTERLSTIVEEKLLSSEDVLNLLKSANIKEGIVEAVDEIVEEKLAMPLIPENLLFNIKRLLSEKIVSFVEHFLEKKADKLADNIDVQEAVKKKMLELPMEEIESMVYAASGKHLRMITLFGGVLGFLLGSIQAGMNYFF